MLHNTPHSSPSHCVTRQNLAQGGFALIATISVMTLLVMVALAMLGLSTIELRSAKQGDAQEVAKANARLSLMLALGQLQKAAGPDRRITAPGNILDARVSPGITGVWESYPLNPNKLPDLAFVKKQTYTDKISNGELVQWLTSSSLGIPSSNALPDSKPGKGLTSLLSLPSANASLAAKTIAVSDRGGLSWVTMDEGVKSRLDLAEVHPVLDELILARLRSPEHHGTEVIDAVKGLVFDSKGASRLTSLGQGQLVSPSRELLAERFHDLTTWAAGLHTNVADGGLKGDLTTAFEKNALPSELLRRRVYSNSDIPLVPADPYFSSLAEYYKLYQKQSAPGQTLTASIPSSYTPTHKDNKGDAMPNLQAREGQVLIPLVTRVNVVFSLIGRVAHGHWRNTVPSRSGDSRRFYMVYLIYTPVVTLYNPYTQPIKVDQLKSTFRYLPLAFQFYRSGKAQNASPVLLSQMHIASQNTTEWEDSFSCTLSDVAGSYGSSLELKPGEARVFGVSHRPGTRWGSMTNYLWRNDLHLSRTQNIRTGSGFNYNSGFIVDWLAPTGPGRGADNRNLGVFGVRGDDTVDVSFEPRIPTRNGKPVDSFGVDITAHINGKVTQLSSYRYKYGTRDRLIKAMEGGNHPTLEPVTYPVRREKPWKFNEIYQTDVESKPIEDWTGPKQFAIFTLASRTSKDSLYPTQAGKQASFVQPVLDMDITNTHPAQMPMELSFLPIKGQGANTVGSIDVGGANDPRSFYFSGWSAQNGILHHPVYQIPRAPLTNLAEFRHANLASSGHLPAPTYTVGDSWAHPLLPAGKVIESNSHLGYVTADHSWLSNNTLWDRYYFSGIRRSSDVKNFLEQSALPLSPRQIPYLPQGIGVDMAEQTITGANGWASTAAYQLHKGSFNVNSTSVEAWKAFLSSLIEHKIPQLNPTTLVSTNVVSEHVALPRLYDSPAGSLADINNANTQTRWSGFQDLTSYQIEALAEAIVDEVRSEGPFLSLSEFLNRNPRGAVTGTAQAGLLERAIRKAGINQQANKINARLISRDEAKSFEYPNPEAAVGNTEEAASAFLSQGDLLSVVGSSLTVRSDTFRIRAYGEARDVSGRVIARATCEAIVQRVPDYIDPRNAADTRVHETGLNTVNETFGRRFKIVNFRWVRPDEV